MKKILYFKVLVLFVCFFPFTKVTAQLSTNEKPFSFGFESKMQVIYRSTNSVVTMPLLDLTKIEKESEVEGENDIPLRYGYRYEVNFNLQNSGTWYMLPNGDKLWQLEVICPNALSINLCYDRFWLPEGGKFFVYSKDKMQTLGAFTSKNNKGDSLNVRGFATELIYGNDVILEYCQPKDVATDAIISIGHIVHGYRYISFGGRGFGGAGNCMVNINCEEGQKWQNEKSAIARFIIYENDFSIFGSGSLINATDLSEKPFFLTANHIMNDDGKDAIRDSILDNTIFYWNYEAPGCVNVSNEPTYYTTCGAIILANNNVTDFALLRLTEDPKSLSNYTHYYLGWDISGESGDSGVCIHHPMGDVKKISTVDGQPQSTYWSSQPQYSNSHWRVSWKYTQNGHGKTQPGSSGSPLLNASHRVIGQLHGGSGQDCSAYGYSKYGKIDISWNGNNNDSIQRRMSCWIDSMNTGRQTMEGLLIIPAARTLTTNEQLYGNIRIKGTGQMNIQSDIEMMGNSCVIVEPGGKLIIDGGTLSNAELVLKPESILQIINGGKIEARNGFKAPVGARVLIDNGRIE